MNFINRIVYLYLLPKSWEKQGEIYRKLGVLYFLKITPFEVWRSLTGKGTKTIKNRNDIFRYLKETILGELTHLFSFIFLLGISLFFIHQNKELIAQVIILFNVLINLYPIFLMRYNRLRLEKAIGRSLREILQSKALFA